jgi:hypothetical protein
MDKIQKPSNIEVISNQRSQLIIEEDLASAVEKTQITVFKKLF